MTEARNLAWTLYLLRIEALISEQLQPWSQGHPVGGLHLTAPSEASVKHIERFLDMAFQRGQQAVLGEALDHVVSSIDAIDNTRPKIATLRACRADLQKSYDALHVLKERSKSAKAEGAVDPVLASSVEPSTRD
ncbi:MAG TPA: hypothetical protein VK504_25530 [Vicinamibacterales bacterium]|nr:hypothetical protein [Vicinamibacterales bacterium]